MEKAAYLNRVLVTTARLDFVMILGHVRDDRIMKAAAYVTRCVRAGEIHEFVKVPDVADASDQYRGAAYVGFAEFRNAAVIHVGQGLWINETLVGKIVGFDETHLPNHMNILIGTPDRVSGVDMGLRVHAAGEIK